MSIKTNLTTSANLAAELAKFIDVKLVAHSISSQAFSSSYTAYNFLSEIVDSHNAFNGTQFIAPYTGSYDITANIPATLPIGATLDLTMYVNGSPVETLFGLSTSSNIDLTLMGSLSQYPLNASDVVTFFARNVTTTAFNIARPLTPSVFGTLTISARIKLP
jgi:hypothetical protein